MKTYSCVFIDLDHTLWDYETNAEETLKDLYVRYRLEEKGVTSLGFFLKNFQRINRDLWDRCDRGLIGQDVIRTERFDRVFTDSGVEDLRAAREFSRDYLRELSLKKNLLPQAREVLEYLHTRYPITVVTNGFDEVQSVKIASAGIGRYFRNVVTSQRAGSKKPSPKIFEFALREAGHEPDSAIMIGDNLQTDIAGATAAGIDSIYYNPGRDPHSSTVTREIASLSELRDLL